MRHVNSKERNVMGDLHSRGEHVCTRPLLFFLNSFSAASM